MKHWKQRSDSPVSRSIYSWSLGLQVVDVDRSLSSSSLSSHTLILLFFCFSSREEWRTNQRSRLLIANCCFFCGIFWPAPLPNEFCVNFINNNNFTMRLWDVETKKNYPTVSFVPFTISWVITAALLNFVAREMYHSWKTQIGIDD